MKFEKNRQPCCRSETATFSAVKNTTKIATEILCSKVFGNLSVTKLFCVLLQAPWSL